MEALASARDALKARQAFIQTEGAELNVGVGDQVLVHREFLVTPKARARPCHKLRPKRFGPFKVVERISANAFRLDLPHALRCHPVFNVTALKKYSFLHSLAGCTAGSGSRPRPGPLRYIPTVNVGKLFSHAPRMAQITMITAAARSWLQ